MSELRPDDARAAVAAAAGALRPHLAGDWSVKAGDLDWDCRTTLAHAGGALIWYAANLATQSTGSVGIADFDPSEEIKLLVSTLGASGEILARVVEASPPGARGYHGAGMADATGYLAMGCDETLVHAYDVCAGFGAAFEAPAEIADRVVSRIFPWAPAHADPWERLLWCNGRIALPSEDRLGPEWGWWCAPLDEWDGVAYTDHWPGD